MNHLNDLAKSSTKPSRRQLPYHAIAAFVLPFLLYAGSAPRVVALEDDGFFVLNGYFLGLNHPPGYPLFTLASHLFARLPLDNVAYQVHLASAFFGASSCLVMFLVLRQAGLFSRLVALSAVLALASSKVFWSQSIIAEVYTLNTFLFALMLLMAVKLSQTRDDSARKRLIYVAALVFGLGLSNHWPLFVLAFPPLLFLLWRDLGFIVYQIPKALLALLAGLSPYLWMYWHSQQDLTVSFQGPIEDLSQLFHFIMRRDFKGADVHLLATRVDKFQFVAFSIREFALQYTLVGLLIAGVGLYSQRQASNKTLVQVAVSGILLTIGMLLWRLSFDYDSIYQATFRVYSLIPYCLMTVLIAFGLKSLLARLPDKLAKPWVVWLVASILPLANLASHHGSNNRADFDWSRRYAEIFFSELPANSILFVDGDIDLGVLAYYHQVERQRADIDLYSINGLLLNNRLYDPRSNQETRASAIASVIENTNRPVVFTHRNKAVEFGYVDQGLFYRVDKNLDRNVMSQLLTPIVEAFFQSIAQDQDAASDPWAGFHRELLMERYGRLVGRVLHQLPAARQDNYLNQFGNDYYWLLGFADGALQAGSLSIPELIIPLLEKAQAIMPKDLNKRYQALSWSFLALSYQLTGKLEQQREMIDQSLLIEPSSSNPAYRLYRQIEATEP